MNATIKEEFTRVQRTSDNKYNLINAQGKLLSKQWFDWVEDFDEGLARVKRVDGKFNLIGENGKFLSEQWFEWIGDFENGLARVQRERENPRFNYIDTDGKIISDEWFRWVDFFKDGLAVVGRINGEWAKLDKQGKIVISK